MNTTAFSHKKANAILKDPDIRNIYGQSVLEFRKWDILVMYKIITYN